MDNVEPLKVKSFERYAFSFFGLYVLFYAGQSIVNTYMNLYLNSIGLSKMMIGTIVAVSTFLATLMQPVMGYVSDEAKSKNRVLAGLYLAVVVLSLMFYINTGYWYLIVISALFYIFFNPIAGLQDNLTLEFLAGNQDRETRWDYGKIRVGGTIGYCIMVLITGFVFHDQYSQMFIGISLFLVPCAILVVRLPLIEGHRKGKQKTSVRILFRDRFLLNMYVVYIVFSIGLSYFYNFYSIYFVKALHARSSKVGILMFVCAITEVPMLFMIEKIKKKMEIRGLFLLAGFVTAMRWVLLSYVTNPNAAIAVNLLHGAGYTSISYCMVTYIAETVPKDLMATGQMLNVIIASALSKIFVGTVEAKATEVFGTPAVALMNGLVLAASVAAFFFLTARKKKNRTDGQGS